MTYRTKWAAGLMPLLTLSLALGACGGGAADDEPAPATTLAPEDVAVAQITEVRSGVFLAGSLDPYRVVEVRAQIPGTLEWVGVEQGEVVSSGKVLARYDALTLETQVAGARAALAAAEAGVEQAEHAEAAAEKLAAAGGISEQDLRGARSGAEAARAQRAATRAQLRLAEEALERAVVRAPVDGAVSRRMASAGEAVTPGRPLFTLVDVDTLELVGHVSADRLAHVRVGDAVRFDVDAYPGRVFEGTVARVEPVVDPATRQVTVYVRLPNEGGELVGGLYATGTVVTSDTPRAVTLPSDAVRGSGEGSYVLLVSGGTLVRRSVVPGPVDARAGRTAILQGVEDGDVVLVAPQGDLAVGATVRLAAASSGGALPGGSR